MKTFPLSLHTLLLAGLLPFPAFAQNEEGAKDSSSEVKSILADPRLRNMLRTVKEDPEAAAKSLKEDPDDLVNSATALFQKQLTDKEKSGDIPSTDSMKSTAGQALDKLKKMIPSAASSTPDPGEVPATRSAVEAARANPAGGTQAPVAADLPAVPRPPESPPAPSTESLTIPASAAPPIPAIGNTVPTVPDTPALAAGDIPAPKPLKAKSKRSSGKGDSDAGSMEIKSREAEMNKETGNMTFKGDVFVTYSTMSIKSDKLEVYMDGEAGAGGLKKAIATGGMVEIKRINPDGKTQIAIARKADYDAASGDVILSGGPPYLQDGGDYVKTTSNDSKIILRGNGKYEIKGSERVNMRVKVKGGKSMNKQMGLKEGLGNFGQ